MQKTKREKNIDIDLEMCIRDRNQTQLDDKLEKISVFARVSPEHKLKIVNAYKRKGKTVAMTGRCV